MTQIEQLLLHLMHYAQYFWGALLALLFSIGILLKTFGPALAAVLLAAYLAGRWQFRNWIFQQRISDNEKLNFETKKLFDDLVTLASKRHFRTRRLYWALQAGNLEKIELARIAYDETLFDWNETELSWNVRFIKNLPTGTKFLDRIHQTIRIPFVVLGEKLERCIRDTVDRKVSSTNFFSKADIVKIENTFTALSNAIFKISRDVYSNLDYLNAGRLDEDKIVTRLLIKEKFEELNVGQLFKAVLTSNKNVQSS